MEEYECPTFQKLAAVERDALNEAVIAGKTNKKLYFRHMPKQQPFALEIDKLTRSIENAITGDSFKTEVLELTPADIRKIKKVEWLVEQYFPTNS